MAYTDREIEESRKANNIPDNYVAIRTTSGGFVFVNPSFPTTINAYVTGRRTGGPEESADLSGIALRSLPKPTPIQEVIVRETNIPIVPMPESTPVTTFVVRPTTTPVPPATVVIRPVTTPTPRPTFVKKTAQVPILVEIIAKPPTIQSTAVIKVEVSPAEFPQQTKNIQYNFSINTLPISVNISEPMIETANQFLQDIISVYIDEDRELKTLLNYGEDKQSVVLSYRKGPIDINGIESIQLKLLQPVPDDVSINSSTFLSREVAKTIIDNVRVRFAPELDATPYLRPKNLKANINVDTGKFVRNVTFNKLNLQSGSVGRTDVQQNKTFEDEIFRQWYSYDFNSSELNIDFTDYSNFIFYSSATMRLAAFKQKLEQLEKLENLRKQIITPYTTNTASAGFIYVQEKSEEYALEKENIIRAFDRYEQYLYFSSGSTSAYSASFDYVDGGTEYNPIGYWPKSGSGLWPIASQTAIDWYETQSLIAQRFDEFNENNLVNTIPTHVREDHDNGAYLTFVSMIGQLFDNIKIYVDQFPNVYSRNLNPNEELSKDLINEIAESAGFRVPTIDSIYNLTDNILGTNDGVPRRDLVAEIYKRLLHNLPFFAKAKGTKTALQAFLNTLGITPQLLSVRETGTPVTSSYVIFDEYTTGLDFDETKTSFIRLPIVASNRNPTTLQFNCTIAKNQNMTLLTGDDKWALNITRHPTISTLGRFELASGSTDTVVVSSSYYNIFGDELLNIALQTYNSTSSLYFRQVDGEDIIFTQTVVDANKFPTLWNATDYVFMGGAGARVKGRYDGTLDEIRLWSESLSDEVLLNTAFDPGSNAGDTYSDAADNLLIQLSFNTIVSASLASNNIANESPYKNISVSPSLENLFCVNITEEDFTRYNRTVKQLTIPVGSSATITNKITVVGEPKFINSSQGLRLYRNKSIVQPEQKKLNRGRNKVILAMSPTDVVNQNIIRNLGLENINAVLGAPTTLYTTFEKSLTVLKNHYQQYYYVDVNTNKFIRILSDLSSVLNQVVDYFIPSKATLLKGIVIEPNILEQVKVPPVKNIRFYGKNARKTVNAPSSLTGSAADYGATFNLSQTITQPQPTSTANYSTIVSQSNNADVTTTVLATYNVFTSQSTVNSNVVTMIPEYKTYDLQHLTWEEYRPISNSYVSGSTENVSGSRRVWPKQKLDLGFSSNKIISGGYATVSASVDTEVIQTISSQYKVYDLKNLTWEEYRPISNSYVSGSKENVSGSRRVWPKQVLDLTGDSIAIISASYSAFTSSISVVDLEKLPITTEYKSYDLQHVSWGEYRQISNSYVSGTVENVSGSAKIWPKQKIDIGLKSMNKFGYDESNNRISGNEPYNRIYTRKLFNEEIVNTRLAGTTSLYTPALYDIPPTADFRDFGVYTYFNNSEGIYYFDEIKKIPTYPSVLNRTWDFDNQSFSNIATWSFESRYNKNDVVYQDVSDGSFNLVNVTGSITQSPEFLRKKELIKFAKNGNKRYYVFKTRPTYKNPIVDGVFYSGSVPSYLPPSLDKKNWDVLRFKPVQVRSPKRVVFDTYTISEPELNNFKTTTISVDTIINIPDRYIDRFEIGTIPASDYVVGELALQNIAVLFAIQSSVSGLRLRLYRTEAARDADISRNQETRPTGPHGVLLDTNLTGTDSVEISNPIHTLVAGEVPPNAKIFYTINNLDNSTKLSANIQFYYFAMEIEPRVPIGYLRKHYRFFRDNSTATKRRNYLGCKNTVDTTVDGLPPIQVFIGEGTEIKVAPTITNEEIITGGGGTLNVT